MRAFIGLTKSFWNKYDELVAELAELGITTIQQAEEFGLEEQYLHRLRMGLNVVNNPEINLFHQDPNLL